MWSPTDKSALPTIGDLEKAKEAINLVQIDLDVAIEQLEQAQIRVDTLRRDLEERKAWVALVRRLPFDVLSMIFDWCADVDWESPVHIACVCRVWRLVILETPRAWSFVDLHSEMPAEGINMFFERSRQLRLHIDLPKSRPFELLWSVAHRICCLTLESVSSLPPNAVFPNVRRFSITMQESGILVSNINVHQFPTLIHLSTRNAPLYSAGPPLDSNFVLPPLESWILRIGSDISWCVSLNICQNTLVSLSLRDLAEGRPLVQYPILLPVLKYLELEAEGTLRRGLLDLKTPILETYTEYAYGRSSRTSPIHTDISTAREMRFSGTPSLSYCTGVQKLQLCHTSPRIVHAVLQQLAMDSGICPALQIIEILTSEIFAAYISDDIALYTDALFDTNRSRPHPICLIVSSGASDLPGVIPEICGWNMPGVSYFS